MSETVPLPCDCEIQVHPRTGNAVRSTVTVTAGKRCRVHRITDEIIDELVGATRKFGPFASVHEGYAVILEELDELWAAIKDKGCREQEMREEAIQVGAMAIRFVLDLLPEPGDEQ